MSLVFDQFLKGSRKVNRIVDTSPLWKMILYIIIVNALQDRLTGLMVNISGAK